MCALVALTACGTGVKQSVRTPVEMGERIELKTPDPKMGLTINEALAALPGFARLHPLQPEQTAQGALELLYETGKLRWSCCMKPESCSEK